MTSLWRINISPAAHETVDPREFCFRKGIVGFGWPVESKRSSLTWDHYYRLANRRYYDNGDKGWWPAVNGLHNRMTTGDLIWSRDWNNVYYLGKVSGEWEYSTNESHRKADIVNFRKCEWFKVGLAEHVPGAVRNSFSRGRTLQAVRDPASLSFSQSRFNHFSRRLVYRDSRKPDASDLFGLLSCSAVEDLVGLYLQSRGYSLVPSSCHRTSAKYEFVLRHRKTGRPATVQVKAGGQTLNRDEFSDLPGEIFLFASSGRYSGGEYPNVRCISRAQLQRFAQMNHRLLPETITIWMQSAPSAS
jgi:hypothetical protein